MIEKKKRDPKKVIIIVVAVSISLTFLLMTVIPYLVFNFIVLPDINMNYKEVELNYKKPITEMSVSGVCFDTDELNLIQTPITGSGGLAAGTMCLLEGEGINAIITLPEESNFLEELYDDASVFTSDSIVSYGDFFVFIFNYEPSLKDFIFATPEDINRIYTYCNYKRLMFDGVGNEITLYDAKNGNFRFLVQKSIDGTGEDMCSVSAFQIRNNDVTVIESEIFIFDKHSTLTDEEVLEFLSTFSYNPSAKTVDELEVVLETYLIQFGPGNISLAGNSVIGEDHFVVFKYTSSTGEYNGNYAIDLTGTKAFKCSEDFKSTDEWVQLGKD